VSVATYLLQHPSRSAPAMLPVQWSLVNVFAEDGIAAVHTSAAARVARNRGGSRRTGEPATEVDFGHPPATFAVTIADVSVDGSFPADGFQARVASWVRATIEAWTQPLPARARSSAGNPSPRQSSTNMRSPER